MNTSPELLARPGDNIREKYQRLLRHIESQRLVSTDDRVHVAATANGQHVTLTQRGPSIPTPLQVSQVGADAFVVSEGYINGRLPRIATIMDGEQPLVDEDGVPHTPARLPADRPIVVAAEVRFTILGARLVTPLDGVKIITLQPERLLRTGSADYAASEQGPVVGHIPLAYSRGGRFIQFVTHNLQARAYLRGRWRVIYWPA